MDDSELLRRAVLGFAETVATLGHHAGSPAVEVRRPDAIGAHLPAAADSHWLDAVVVPHGAKAPRDDDAALPHALWTLEEGAALAGRAEAPSIAMPCLGLVLDAGLDLTGGVPAVECPPLPVAGALNDRAYEQSGQLEPLIGALGPDPRVAAHGVRTDDGWACVALTVRIGDDVSVQYVATEADHRRQGHASRLLRSVLAAARADGATSATLQASPDGLPVYERLGFRRLGALHAYLR